MPWGYFEEAVPVEGGLGCLAIVYFIPYVLVWGGCCVGFALLITLADMYKTDPAGAVFMASLFIFVFLALAVAPATVVTVLLWQRRRKRIEAERAAAESRDRSVPLTVSHQYQRVRTVGDIEVGPDYVTPLWWLAPIAGQWLGGLVAWYMTRERNPEQARNMLLLGILLSILQVCGSPLLLFLGAMAGG